MRYPKISIITCSYNQGQFLEEAISSVLSQNYPNLEYIIIDGGSTDNSVEIIKKYEKYLTYWISEKDKGQADALNKGFAKATGDIFAWLNSSDIYNPGILHKVAEYWVRYPDCHFLAGDGEHVDSTDTKIEYYIKVKPYSFKELLHFCGGTYLPQPSVFFSREAFLQAGGLNPALYYTMDLDLWLRIVKRHQLHYLPICISKLRRHEDAKTQLEGREACLREASDIIRSRFSDINIFDRIIINEEARYEFAKIVCGKGLKEYFRNDKHAAINSFKEALIITPRSIFSRIGLMLFLRIALPKRLKKLIFKKP